MQNEMSEFVSLLAEEKRKSAIIAEEKRRIEEEKKVRLTPRVDIGSSLSEFFTLVAEAPRIPKTRKNQDPDTHSDLYTDENPKGTIHGLGFKDVATAKASVKKIINSGKTHAHKIQAAIAMEQRARVMGKTAEAAVFRKYIEKMKKKTKEKQNEEKVDILKTFFQRLNDFEEKLDEAAFAAVPPEEVPNAMQQMADRISKVVPDSAKPKPMDDISVLARDFKVFKEIVTRQLASMTAGNGCGGSANCFYFFDIDVSSLGDGKFLVYNASTQKLEFTDQVDGN